MLDEATAAFVEAGRALIVGTVAPDGAPYATRGWGLAVSRRDGATARLLVSKHDEAGIAHVADGGPIAMTATDVRTLRSLQMKGRCTGVEPATDADRALAERYTHAFFSDVERTDGVPKPLLVRLVPEDYVACTVTIEEHFDQTPGPGAGASLLGGGVQP